MDEVKFKTRVAELLEQEDKQPLCWWYLSFADNSGFKGATIVWARGITTAVLETKLREINPGGEVVGQPIPKQFKITRKAANRLLSKKDIKKFFGDTVGLDGKKK